MFTMQSSVLSCAKNQMIVYTNKQCPCKEKDASFTAKENIMIVYTVKVLLLKFTYISVIDKWNVTYWLSEELI